MKYDYAIGILKGEIITNSLFIGYKKEIKQLRSAIKLLRQAEKGIRLEQGRGSDISLDEVQGIFKKKKGVMR